MLRPSDNMVLQIGTQKVKFLAESRNSDGKIVIFFGMVFRIYKRFGVNGVKLNVCQTFFTACKKNFGEHTYISVGIEFGVYLNYCRGGSRSFGCGELCNGIKKRGKTAEISSLHW